MEKIAIPLKSTGNFLQDVKTVVERANFLTFMKHCYRQPPYLLDYYTIEQGSSPDEVIFILNVQRISETPAQSS